MTQRDNGGSAFPSTPLGDDGKPGGAHRFGMSLRDWFAGQALSSIPLRSWDYLSSGDDKVKAWATLAYAVADAMLAARSPAQEAPQPDPRDELLREVDDLLCLLNWGDRDDEVRSLLTKIREALGDD